ncbi:MAG: zinc-dependent alcohol dehydrogenase [Bacilli bacterium]
MKQALLSAAEQIAVCTAQEPVAGERDVVLRVDHVGICGSDIHAYYDRHPFIQLPIVLGHEATGVVASIGSQVSRLAVGDRIVIEPTLACGQCERCLSGRPHICDRLRVVGCQFPGAFAEYVVIPEENAIPLPDHVSLQHGAMVEPLAVGVRACRRGGVAEGSTVCIVGAGTIGIMTAVAARELGAARVVLLDVSPVKCSLAQRMGFEAVCNAGAAPQTLLRDLFGAKGPDTMLECVGVASSLRFCVEGAPKGGRIVIVGVFEEDVTAPMALVQDRELELLGTLMYTRADFLEALSWMAAGRIDAQLLITRVFPLAEAAQAFAFIRDQKGSAVKVMLRPQRL